MNINRWFWIKFGWKEISMDQIPKNIWETFHRDFNRNYSVGDKMPYDKVYTYKEKPFWYKIIKSSETQGGVYYLYRKLRKK